MFKTLEIKNFKSIGHAKFDLGKINVLTGQSNLGKSNVVQAIYCLVHNHWDSNYLKWGATSCSIKLIDEDDRFVEYRHGKDSSASYIMSGFNQPFTKIGRDVPQPVQEFFKMNSVPFDEDLSLDFNFERQFDPSFVISLSGFELAKVFGKLMNLDIVLSASRNINKDLAGLRKQTDGQEAIQNVSISYIEENYAIELKYGLLHHAIAIDAKAEQLDQENAVLRNLLIDLDYYSEQVRVYSEFLESESVKQIDEIREPIQSLDTILTGAILASETIEHLQGVLDKEIPEFDFKGVSELSGAIVDLAYTAKRKSILNSVKEKTDSVDYNLVSTMDSVRDVIFDFEGTQQNIEQIGEDLDNADFHIDMRYHEFLQELKKNNICPISGKPFEEGCIDNLMASV